MKFLLIVPTIPEEPPFLFIPFEFCNFVGGLCCFAKIHFYQVEAILPRGPIHLVSLMVVSYIIPGHYNAKGCDIVPMNA